MAIRAKVVSYGDTSVQECKEEERGLAQVEGRREGRGRSAGAAAVPGVTQVSDGVTSYLVASSPEVLSHLLRENEARGDQFNPALYTNPANALNITKVDFAPVESGRHPPPSPLPRRPRQPSQSSCHSLERRDCTTPRSLPGSAHSTLSRGASPSVPPRRRPSAARSGHSSSQVPTCPLGVVAAACVSYPALYLGSSFTLLNPMFPLICTGRWRHSIHS